VNNSFLSKYVRTELLLYMTVTFDFVASTTIYKKSVPANNRETHSLIHHPLFLQKLPPLPSGLALASLESCGSTKPHDTFQQRKGCCSRRAMQCGFDGFESRFTKRSSFEFENPPSWLCRSRRRRWKGSARKCGLGRLRPAIPFDCTDRFRDLRRLYKDIIDTRVRIASLPT